MYRRSNGFGGWGSWNSKRKSWRRGRGNCSCALVTRRNERQPSGCIHMLWMWQISQGTHSCFHSRSMKKSNSLRFPDWVCECLCSNHFFECGNCICIIQRRFVILFENVKVRLATLLRLGVCTAYVLVRAPTQWHRMKKLQLKFCSWLVIWASAFMYATPTVSILIFAAICKPNAAHFESVPPAISIWSKRFSYFCFNNFCWLLDNLIYHPQAISNNSYYEKYICQAHACI